MLAIEKKAATTALQLPDIKGGAQDRVSILNTTGYLIMIINPRRRNLLMLRS